MDKKYKLTDETITHLGRTLHRIEALQDFGGIKAGDRGGYIEREDNLDQDGMCWAYDGAKVWGNAKVYGDAKVWGNAKVYGDAKVGDNADVFGNADVYGDADVGDNASVYGNAKVWGNADVFGNAEVYGNAKMFGNANICRNEDYIVFKNWWSSGRYFTWTRSNNMWRVGCFYGTGKELIEKAYKDSETSGREYERIVKYVEAIREQEQEQEQEQEHNTK